MNAKRVNMIHTEIVKDKSYLYKDRKISSPEAVAKFVAAFFLRSDREKLIVICVNAKAEPVSIEISSIGTVDQSCVGIREVFKSAILQNAAGIIIAHNHPSGSISPSDEDKRITKRVKESGELLGIKLYDHLIIGDDNKYFSFADKEMM